MSLVNPFSLDALLFICALTIEKCLCVFRRLSLSTNCIEKITNLNGLSKSTVVTLLTYHMNVK